MHEDANPQSGAHGPPVQMHVGEEDARGRPIWAAAVQHGHDQGPSRISEVFTTCGKKQPRNDSTRPRTKVC